MLGVPGLMDVYRAGGITIANAPGTGIADDKAIYSATCRISWSSTPARKPILKNVPTWRCSEEDTGLCARQPRRGGGEGGARLGRLRHAGGSDRLEEGDREVPQEAEARPGNYIAQPTLALSTVPILTRAGLAPRHVDLRPFVLVGPEGSSHHAGRADARGAEKGLAGGELVARAAAPRTPGCWRTNAMLGKTAGGLFWMFRYLERAENTARLIEAGFRIALTRPDGADDEWASVLQTAGVAEGYAERHDEVEAGKVIDYLLRDKDQPLLGHGGHRRGAAERAAGAHGADPRGVGGRQRHLHDPEGRAGRPVRNRDLPEVWPRSASNRRWCAARCTARCCATTSSISAASAPSSNAPTTPRASST
jgi:hypothetical protein